MHHQSMSARCAKRRRTKKCSCRTTGRRSPHGSTRRPRRASARSCGSRSTRAASITSTRRQASASSLPLHPRWLLGSAAALVLAGPAAAAAPVGETIVSALAGPPKASFLARIRAGEMGGVILTHRWTPAEFAATTARLHATSCEIGRPLLIFVDQEGGSIRRLTWAPPTHSEGQLGRLGSAQTQGEATAAATALRAAGVDVDLAPVADTLGPGGFLGDRSFG